MEYSDLQGMLPAIVPIRIHGYDHFVVVREIKGGKVFFADPAYGRRDMTVSQFERAWEQKIAFVVRRRPK
jgi:predicted double-glycine peptidase